MANQSAKRGRRGNLAIKTGLGPTVGTCRRAREIEITKNLLHCVGTSVKEG
jgi:hypothetical protein